MSKFEQEQMMKLKERIDGLKRGSVKPSEVRLNQAGEMIRYYNQATAGNRKEIMNDGASVALAQRLEALAAEIVMEDSEPLVLRSLLSNAPDVGPWAESYAYQTVEAEGEAKVIANYADDLPSPSFNGPKVTHNIIGYGAKAEWSLQDLERSVALQMDLPSEQLREARAMWDRGLEDCLAFGNSTFGIPNGLANQTTGTGAAQVQSTTASSASWTGTINNAAAVAMLGDLSNLVAEHEAAHLGLYPATHLILPPGALQRTKQALLTESGKTVAQHFMEANPGVQMVASTKFGNVDSVGDSYDGRGLILNNSPRVVQAIIAREFSMLAPQPKNLAFIVPGYGRTGGVAIKKRVGLRYLTRVPTE